MMAELSSKTGPEALRRKLALCAYLTRMEFDRRFAGSVGGKIWMFASPLAAIAVIGSALHFGLGSRASMDPHYGVSLTIALCAWLFFADAVNASTSTIVASPHLVKKVVFPVALLPISATLAIFIVHLCVLGAVIGVLLIQGKTIGWSILYLPFWALCLLLITAGFALATAGMNVVLRDMSAIVPNLIGLLFWITPIVWPAGNAPASLQLLVKLNPLGVVFDGYRHALIGTEPPLSFAGTVAFLCGAIGFLLLMFGAFQRARAWFANVL